MILVDSSVWIDHFHQTEAALVAALGANLVLSHTFVIQELALGSIAKRQLVLGLLGALPKASVLSHDEWLALCESHRLWSHGLSPIDVHLLGSTLLQPGLSLWTRDKRLRQAALEVGATVFADNPNCD
ncbi:MAG: type II toxin-antitoxin system VapC family toxin [Propionibacteriaceae bacterium]|jgi:predicted nucleic acid-binding protein|nr:type II toxin-antitoxin system VapC family toxin [Propionibacteriaceae bacterium]